MMFEMEFVEKAADTDTLGESWCISTDLSACMATQTLAGGPLMYLAPGTGSYEPRETLSAHSKASQSG